MDEVAVMSAPGVVAGLNFTVDGTQFYPLPAGWTAVDVANVAAVAQTNVVYLANRVNAAKDWFKSASMVTGGGGGEPVWRVVVGSALSVFLCGPGMPGPVGAGPVTIVDIGGDVSRVAGPWNGLRPRELLTAFAAFRRLVGVDWASSVGMTAQRLILDTHPRVKGGVLLDRAPWCPEISQGSALEQPWTNWSRPFTEDEAAAKYVHAFDANAQYLGAWGVVELGHGQPVHHKTVPGFDKNRVGFWRYPDLTNLRPMCHTLPKPWLDGREWLSTPTVVRMLEECDGLDVPAPLEAWLWPQRSRFLRGAAERLRDARAQAIMEAAKAKQLMREASPDDVAAVDQAVNRLVSADTVLEAVKAIYRVQTGRFGMGRDEHTETSPWNRPDWGHLVRATARVNLHRRLAKLGAHPFAIATDGLLFATDEPDGLVFAHRIGLPIGDGLGYYRYEGTAPREVVEAAGTVTKRFAAIQNGSVL